MHRQLDNPNQSHSRLSIIIPTFNERQRLPPTLDAIHAYLAEQGQLATTEVIIADDGSVDGTGALVARRISRWKGLSLLLLPHAGKGSAVRQGVLASQGDFIFLCDCDLSMPISELSRFLQEPYARYDLAIGSREAPGAQRIGEPQMRHVMGRVFNRLVQVMAVDGINDTQCGFKLIRRAAALDLFSQMSLPGFGFDVELLALARRRGYSIIEVPIHWYYGVDSRVRPLRDTIRMIGEVWQVRQHLRHQATVEPNPEVEFILAQRQATITLREPAIPALTREQHHDILN